MTFVLCEITKMATWYEPIVVSQQGCEYFIVSNDNNILFCEAGHALCRVIGQLFCIRGVRRMSLILKRGLITV
jgi:hypothetical protein